MNKGKGTAYKPAGENEEIVQDQNPQCVKFSGEKNYNMITIS
jgi:hypothetical protein